MMPSFTNRGEGERDSGRSHILEEHLLTTRPGQAIRSWNSKQVEQLCFAELDRLTHLFLSRTRLA